MNPASPLALAINRVSFLSATEKIALFERVPTEQLFERLTIADLSHICGRSIRSSNWKPFELLKAADEDERFLAHRHIDALLYDSYPAQLGEIRDAPFLLYVRGMMPAHTKPWLAVVGTRAPSQNGLSAAMQLAIEAAACGIVIVSGMARGIDAAAHTGVIRAGGKTIAVQGCGIDRVYPASYRQLAAAILDSGGTMVSEYPPGTPPRRHHFPARNRIISGLASGLVVIEAPSNSGALISAEHAIEQNRDLYVHSVGLESSRGDGAQELVENGAIVIKTIQDILNDPVEQEGSLAISERMSQSSSERSSHGFDPAVVIAQRLEAELNLNREQKNDEL